MRRGAGRCARQATWKSLSPPCGRKRRGTATTASSVAPGDAAQFAIQLEMPDAGSRIMRVYAPVMTAVTLVLSILTAMRGGKSFLWSWTAMLLAGFPAGVLIAYAKPFSTFAKKLYRVGAAVAGWQGARILVR